jgi:hypothetical protein
MANASLDRKLLLKLKANIAKLPTVIIMEMMGNLNSAWTLRYVSGHVVRVPPPPPPGLFDRLPNQIQVSINLIAQVCE